MELKFYGLERMFQVMEHKSYQDKATLHPRRIRIIIGTDINDWADDVSRIQEGNSLSEFNISNHCRAGFLVKFPDKFFTLHHQFLTHNRRFQFNKQDLISDN